MGLDLFSKGQDWQDVLSDSLPRPFFFEHALPPVSFATL